jgi:hypothetical protein
MEKNPPKIRAWSKFLAQIGTSRSTGWRWRRDRLIDTLVIGGRVYVTDEAVDKFISRAAMGEFAPKN